MPANSLSFGTFMVRKLSSIFPLSDEEKQAIHDLPMQVLSPKRDQDIVRIGDKPSHCCLVLEGFTYVYKMTLEGKRQILALYVPGDIPDLQSLHLKTMDISVAPIHPCTVGFIQHDDLRRMYERYPRLTAVLWRETLVHASIHREWLLNNGQRAAYARLAHLLCELLIRLSAVGLVKNGTFHLPITQNELADATGVTSVHMNRIFQALRADGLIETQGKKIQVLNWEKLKQACGFDPLYLQLEDEVA